VVELDKILKKLDVSERSQLCNFMQVLSDSLSRKILAKLASSHTSMCLNDLPLKQLEVADSISIMSRLHKFERMNLVKSKMIKHESGAYRTFDITDAGRRIVKKYLKKEAKLFA
jgi:predicted transcriptional regulator